MNLIRLDHAGENQWRRMWIVVAFVFACLAGAATWLARDVVVRSRDLDEAGRSDLRYAADAPTWSPPAHHSKRASMSRAALKLRLDLNKAFSTLENVSGDEVRLVSVQIDGESGTIRIECMAPTLIGAADLTTAMNAGYPTASPWTLETASSVSQGAGQVAFRVSWIASLDKL